MEGPEMTLKIDDSCYPHGRLTPISGAMSLPSPSEPSWIPRSPLRVFGAPAAKPNIQLTCPTLSRVVTLTRDLTQVITSCLNSFASQQLSMPSHLQNVSQPKEAICRFLLSPASSSRLETFSGRLYLRCFSRFLPGLLFYLTPPLHGLN